MAVAPEGYRPLEIRAKCVYEDDKLLEHIHFWMDAPVRPFMPSMAHDHEIAVVGSGPSLRDTWETVRDLKERGVYIAAVKGAHDFLIERGVIPHIAVMVDPQPHIVQCFQRKRHDVTYFVASQCNPELAEFFMGYPVVRWHLLTGKEGEKEAIRGEPVLGGGSTSGNRTLTLGWMMGFRRFHLFGFDSCLSGDDLKVHQKWTGQIIQIMTGEREFKCNPAMAAQVTEFEKIVNMFRNQAQFKVYGDGAIPHLAKCRRDRGIMDTPRIDEEFRPTPVHEDYWKAW